MKCEPSQIILWGEEPPAATMSNEQGEYSRWGCVYFQPPEQTQLRFEISRGQLAQKIERGEFHNLPVDIGHATEVATVGRVTDAVQARTNGSVFVRIAVKPGTLESDFAISAMRNGGIRGLSLQHYAGDDERKLMAVGITPKPGRPNTFLLPEGTEPPSQLPRSQLASFSAFESVDIYGAVDAHNSNSLSTANTKMASAPATATSSSSSSSAPSAPTTNDAKTVTPAPPPPSSSSTAPKSDSKGVLLDGEMASPEEVKALVEYARKAKQELEETKRIMAEKENLLKPMLEEQRSKALKFVEGMFNHGVAAVSESEKKEIEETQQRLMGLVEADPNLLTKIARFSTVIAPEAKTPQPAREVARDELGRFVSPNSASQTHAPPHSHPDPQREDRRSSSKRNRTAEDILGDPAFSSSPAMGNSVSVEDIVGKRFLREPASAAQGRQLHPSLRDILGSGVIEKRQAVAYSGFTADQTKVFEEFERNRVEALREVGVGGSLLPTQEFPNMRHYEDYLRSTLYDK